MFRYCTTVLLIVQILAIAESFLLQRPRVAVRIDTINRTAPIALGSRDRAFTLPCGRLLSPEVLFLRGGERRGERGVRSIQKKALK